MNNIVFNTDLHHATIFVMKIFDAKGEEVWNYFTNSELLDSWWAPKPWKCETQKMNFENGGTWNYAMVSPENEKHFARIDYEEINPNRSIAWSDYFCDEKGIKNLEFPTTNWLIGFTGVEEGVKLTVNLHFASEKEMNAILEMGFEEGFKATLNQLEEILKK
ncbi:Uncharacterized conserved protein YndB, AHSA1/START domain [Kaistella chaponensis]|uniref:Uncharacterized conserved protein YndB, AHSA1/START domain n=1 Tax=Kaistella chaponensis TaxID=713588 RepID=A0A1N7LDA4_9FLAO|nr:SRPBCC domain-containing protein [Kaistella chaponensis]SIS71809.1 Uncharacterized conserved protein YndB, AHSA1/START domain [Kaistella chaponensis]